MLTQVAVKKYVNKSFKKFADKKSKFCPTQISSSMDIKHSTIIFHWFHPIWPLSLSCRYYLVTLPHIQLQIQIAIFIFVYNLQQVDSKHCEDDDTQNEECMPFIDQVDNKYKFMPSIFFNRNMLTEGCILKILQNE